MKLAPVLAGTVSLVAAASLPAYAEDTTVKDASTVTMSESSLPVVPFGKRATVTGVVSGVLDLTSPQDGRKVALELRTPNGWMPLRSTDATDADGRYSVGVPSSWYYRGTVRTSVSESDTHLPGVSGSTTTVAVKPPYSPEGKPSAWSRAFADRSARWDPCKVITFKVNATGGPARAVRQVRQALAKVSAATGLRFKYAGSTKAVPWRTDGRKPEYADAALTISWATPKQVAPLSGWTVGWGGGWYRGGEVFRGGIALDRTGTSTVENGFGQGVTWGAILMHEIGHVVGLGHAEEQSQVMFGSILPTTRGRFGAGDLTGLREQGAMGGCIEPDATSRTRVAPRSFATY